MRLCFLTSRFPYPPVTGDKARVYHQLRLLSTQHTLSLVSLATRPVVPEAITEIGTYCEQIHVVPISRPHVVLNLARSVVSRRPVQVHLYQSPSLSRELRRILKNNPPSLIHASLLRILLPVWNVREPPVVADLVDSLGLNLESRARTATGIRRLIYQIERNRMRRFERSVISRFPNHIVSSRADVEALGSESAGIIPNGVDTELFGYRDGTFRDGTSIIFSGNIGYPPNEEAVLWFAKQVWPVLKQARPHATWSIVGANPGRRVRALDDPAGGTKVLGAVSNMAEHLQRATVAICPLLSASGVQTKVIEAMSTGTPVVASSLANRGVEATPGHEILVADDAAGVATAILQLFDDPNRRIQLGVAGRELVERRFTWEHHLRQLEALYASVEHAPDETSVRA